MLLARWIEQRTCSYAPPLSLISEVLMRLSLSVTIVLLLGFTGSVGAQDSSMVFTEAAKGQFEQIYSLVLRAAERIDERLYEYRPKPEVRTVAGVIGHIADGNILLCTAAAGDKPQITRTHEKKSRKTEVIAALRESKDFCDRVLATMTDAVGQQVAPAFDPKQKTPRLSWIHANNSHIWEHYGNLVTYMRLNDLVPPSSEGR